MRSLTFTVILLIVCVAPTAARSQTPTGDRLHQTAPLQLEEPLDVAMVRGISRFAERELAQAPARRDAQWRQFELNTPAAEQWRQQQREKLRTIIGAVDPRVPPNLTIVSSTRIPFPFRSGGEGDVTLQVRWDVLEGVTAEGLLLVPRGEVKGYAVAIGDAAWTPEQFYGLQPVGEFPLEKSDSPLLPGELIPHGFVVLVPMLISRVDEFSGHPDIRYTNISHREHVYRMAFEMGRHIIGYEVQKILAAVDLLERMAQTSPGKQDICVLGVGDGGQLALYAAALDARIQQTLVCSYFAERESVWQEPIDRNIWDQLTTLGDAEIAALTSGRLYIVPSHAWGYGGPKPARNGRPDFAAPGKISTPAPESVEREFARLQKLTDPDRLWLQGRQPRHGFALHALITAATGADGPTIEQQKIDHRPGTIPFSGHVDFAERERRQLREMVEFTQRLLHRSDKVRDQFWSQADASSVEAWEESTQPYRQRIHKEMIGRLQVPDVPINPRSRKVLDESTHVGYEVVLDVIPGADEGDPGIIAGGILLLPKDLKEGERRPVVVCQHGLEGTPMDTITTDTSTRAFGAYKGFATQLVNRGFIVYAPQNPYRGEHDFRVIQRKSNPVGRSLFSYIIEQHRVTLKWLATLPWVDAERIGFYGLSYGGKTAVRVPPLLAAEGDESQPEYCLSICSADFNEWIRKNVSAEDRYSYVFTKEYEMFEWNMGHIAGYGDLASLMIPRPFMVERGHNDGVAPDEWVAWEYAKVRRRYNKLGIGDRTEIEFFDGPHTINGVRTFEFLHRHLDWPTGPQAVR